MNSPDIFRDGAATLADRAPTPGHRGTDQRGQSIHEDHNEDIELSVYGESVEIDILQALRAGPNNEENIARPLPDTAPVIALVPRTHNFNMSNVQRPRLLRGMRRSPCRSLLLLCFVAYLIYLLVHSIISSMARPRFQGYGRVKVNTRTTEDTTTTTSSLQDTIDNTRATNIPGFFIIPEAVMMEEVFYDSSYPKSTLPSLTSVTNDAPARTINLCIESHTSKTTDGSEQTGPFHHASPRYAGKVDKSDRASRIKTRLEGCLENMIKKLQGQWIEATSGFEVALNHCKSVIDITLESMFPSQQHAANTNPASTKLSAAVHGVVPGQLKTAASLRMQSTRSNSLSRRKPCNENVCDWINISSLDRCYHRDETEYLKTGKIRYTNDSVDDFKDTAPLECNLCLPTTNQEEIDIHCRRIEQTEKDILRKLLIAGGAIGVMAITGIVFKLGWRRRQEAASKRLPAVMRGGLINKRTIGHPVLIPCLTEQMERAFENPRTAPAPPSMSA